ncbi:Trx7/PDZ domain-containing (seleno)protein [Horticoccus sp. 23ND18S-11]|uniref:Trx7/PDZ domain-containing (seleno)protein n=1 Tax=Horticoccus sp. 23ND18S-11 TaxID=3391832 RepID=UPI0039C9D67A
MRSSRLLGVVAWLLSIPFVDAATVKDREGAVRQDRTAMENDARWIYNDVDRGFAEAKRTGKPLLVVLRCVPCLSCVGLDAQVLAEPTLGPLLDLFVCVRVINANALDLARFQFDYDLSFSTLFFNGDGTLYGRYGSWVHQADPDARETIGYRRSLEGALALHRGYPANRVALEGKQGGPTPFKTPIEIPELAKKYGRELNWGGNVVQSCVHCHQVGEAFRASYRDKGEPVPLDRIYPMPASETVGLTLAPDKTAAITAVAPKSLAATAGFRPGDEFVSFAGQPLLSIADFSWVLHRAPAAGAVAAVVKRDGKNVPLTLTLPDGWRTKTDISKRVGTWSMRAMALGGLMLVDLDDAARKERGLPADGLALFVKGMGQFNKHAAAKKAGFLKDDVIVSIDGLKTRTTESEAIGWLLQARKLGEVADVTVVRGKERVALKLPMQ